MTKASYFMGLEPDGSPEDKTSPSSYESPPYARWEENINYLLEDTEGLEMFRAYLEQENLAHYLEFCTLCNGLKYTEGSERVNGIKIVYRRYLEPKLDKKPKIDCIDDETVQVIRNATLTPEGPTDINNSIFDEAQRMVIRHMSRTCFKNFFKSDIFLKYVQNFSNRVSEDSSPFSETHSLSSSICDRGIGKESKPSKNLGAIPKKASNNSDICDAKTSSTLIQQQPQKLTECNSEKDQKFCRPPLSVSNRSLITLPEEHDESKPQPRQGYNKSVLSSSALPRRPKLPPSTSSNRSQRGMPPFSSYEKHPNMFSYAGLDDNPAAPYHANSSTFNPVSRNDSEIQSQSSGALDDGNRSSFTDLSASQYSNSRINTFGEKKEQKRLEMTQVEKNRQRGVIETDVLHKHKPIKQYPEGSCHTNPHRKEALEQHNRWKRAERKKFAEELIRKLNEEKKKRERNENLNKEMNEKLERCDTKTEFASDQSILDDHCSRVFDEKTPSRTPPRRSREQHRANNSVNMSSSYQTWGGSREKSSQNTSFSSYQPSTSQHSFSAYTEQQHQQFGSTMGQMGYSSTNNRTSQYRSLSDFDAFSHEDQQRRWHQRSFEQAPEHGEHHRRRRNNVMENSWTFGNNNTTLRSTSMTRSGMRTSPRNSGRNREYKAQGQHSEMNHTFSTLQINSKHHPIVERDIIYTFPQKKDSQLPYRVKFREPRATLRLVKEKCPKGERFRFFFKVCQNGITFQEEITDDNTEVPFYNGMIMVEANECEK